MKKRMTVMLVLTLLVFGALFGFKYFISSTLEVCFDNLAPAPASVTAGEAVARDWPTEMEAVGSFVAVNGTTLAAENPGVIQRIRFESGDSVKAGDVLVELDIAADVADLKALEASQRLADQELARVRRLHGLGSVSKAELDRAESAASQSVAQVAAAKERIARKTVRAPFDGELGIRRVNLGQFMSAGDPVVSLQALDQLYLNFSLPEQFLSRLELGQRVQVRVDAHRDEVFEGQISAIEPQVDARTRNVQIQARFDNADRKLRPGFFGRVNVAMGAPQAVVAIPQTAVSFNPYGNVVYVLSEEIEYNPEKPCALFPEPPKPDTSVWRVQQKLVRTGRTRGDLVAVESGLEAGDRIVTSGLLKLRNEALIVVDERISPSDSETPEPPNR